jgi:hypothetical protein
MRHRPPDEHTNGARRDARRGGTVSNLFRAEVSTLRERAGARAEQVARQLRERRDALIREQKHRAARELASIGQALRAAAERLHDRKAIALAPYLTAAAERVEGIARTVRHREPGELAQDLGRAARQQPGAVIGAAFLAGVAVGRFIKAGVAPEPARHGQRSPSQQRRLRPY